MLFRSNNPIYRGETLGTYALVFNAILNYQQLDYQHVPHEPAPADKDKEKDNKDKDKDKGDKDTR